MIATPCLLVVFIFQVFYDFDTYGLVPAYSSCFTFCTCYTCYICYGHCGVTTRHLWVCLRYYIDDDVDVLHFIFHSLMFA